MGGNSGAAGGWANVASPTKESQHRKIARLAPTILGQDLCSEDEDEDEDEDDRKRDVTSTTWE
jgi:hypothetical protein